MLMQPLRKEELPDGSRILAIETIEGGYRGVLLEVDDIGAMSVFWIGDLSTIIDVVDALPLSREEKSELFFPVKEGDLIRYLQSDTLTLAECTEACVDVLSSRSDPPPPTEAEVLRELITRIKGALNTEEDGDALVEVALNAWRAEMEHSRCGGGM